MPESAGAALDELKRFRNEVQKSFLPLEFWLPNGSAGSFASKVVSRKLGFLSLTEGTAWSSFPVRGQLRRDQIAHSSPDWFVLLASQAGDALHTQFGRSDVTTPGKMVLLHGCTPYQVEPDLKTSAMYINIPGALLRSEVGTPEDYCAITMDAGRGLNALFCEFIQLMWRESDALGDHQKNLLSNEFVRLLVATLESVEARALGAPRRSREDQHFEQVLHFIDAHLADPSLGAAQIAGALRLSHSRLHAIVRSKGTSSIGQTIMDRRLKRCGESLADPRCQHRGITQIAFDWGFKNAAHFSQSFKSRFGVSPREYRKLHLPGAGTGIE